MQETWVRFLDREDPMEEGMATHSSILAWRVPMDRGAWWAAVHGATQSRTRLKQLSSSNDPDGSHRKGSTCNAVDARGEGSIPGSRRFPGGGNGNLLQYSGLENPHGQRNLVGYSPWGCEESDTTE